MNDAIRRLDEVMSRLPIDPAALETVLTAQALPPEALHDAAVRFILERCLAQPEALNGEDAPPDTLHCAALPQVLAMLLRHGMPPDRTVWCEGQEMVSDPGEECLLTLLRPIEWGSVAAECARLLLENGASPRLMLAHRGHPFGELLGLIDEMVCKYDAHPDSYVRQLMVLLGFGASQVLRMEPGVPAERLRRFETVDWSAEVTQPGGEWDAPEMTLRFTDRETGALLGVF